MSKRGQREVNAATGLGALLAVSVAACALVPGLEVALDAGATAVLAVVVLAVVFIVVRDLWL